MDYEVRASGMISSSGVVMDSIFDRYDDPERPGYYWFIKHGIPNRAQYVFYGSPNTAKSEGMGGRTIPFKCTDGQTINIQGPWWTNAGSFRKSTGIDITNEYLTSVVISRNREFIRSRNSHLYIDVLYKDDEPVLGSYYRYKDVIKSVFATVDDEKLFLYHESTGGSCHSYERRDDHI